MNIADEVSARILKTLLSVFFLRQTLTGKQFNADRLVRSAARFALDLDEQKTDDERVNQTAVHVAEGLLLAFYQNRPSHKNWTALAHEKRRLRMIQDAYRIAAMMIRELQKESEPSAASENPP
ncbi:hypothetical protein [Thiorhodovibrio frisius]|uniref:Uncharacterized protein n=1 Tax=Thiorhodovibrio frisius TaxID=631362 RepID=H8Z649_9GAMM|nr:hypothetical protein [Thiorhodovibrio frisius]EIC19616.1 hypothetical protein Thi970DRAFT_03202 [Thiorhodovibrio frisius]WPL20419.1 hypothetical protein Thiofri_00512 [Thiorhodovibrio frisius]